MRRVDRVQSPDVSRAAETTAAANNSMDRRRIRWSNFTKINAGLFVLLEAGAIVFPPLVVPLAFAAMVPLLGTLAGGMLDLTNQPKQA